MARLYKNQIDDEFVELLKEDILVQLNKTYINSRYLLNEEMNESSKMDFTNFNDEIFSNINKNTYNNNFNDALLKDDINNIPSIQNIKVV